MLQQDTSQPANGRQQRRATFFHLIILAAATFAFYARTLWNGFVADDNSELLTNHAIRHLSNIPSFFTHGIWFFAGARIDRYYRPLKFAAYSVEYAVFGLHPAPWHLINIALQIAAVVTIYFLVRDLASGFSVASGQRNQATQLAFASALLFGIHPIHVEPVAWISGGSDLQCGAALLLSLWLYHRARSHSQPVVLYGASIVLFAAGLMAKENALTFPAVILSYDFFYRREMPKEMAGGWRRYLGYFAALGVYLALRIHALRGFAPLDTHVAGGQVTPWTLFLSIPALTARYLGKAIVPTDLNYWYTYSLTRTLDWGALAAMALFVCLVAAMFWLRYRQPLLALAFAWFFLTLAPALDLTKVSILFTERYFYVSSFSVCVLAAWAWAWLCECMAAGPLAGSLVRGLGYAGAAALIAFYSYVGVRRIPYWHDDLRLWVRTAEQSPNVAAVNAEVGSLYLQSGRYESALRYTRRAVALDPSQGYFYTNLASAYLGLNQVGEALREAEQGVRLQPDYAPFWLNLATVHRALNQWAKVVETCQRGLEAQKNGLGSMQDLSNAEHALLTLLGLAEWHLGDQNGAIATYKKAIRADPETLDAYINLGNTYAQLHQLDAAIAEFEEALHANPNSPDLYMIHLELGVIYESQSLWRPAALEYQQVLQLNPNFQIARARLQPLLPFLTNPALGNLPTVQVPLPR
ncbi:MAG TPA: tetratricopeptide repeat protein [Bryobacteraceae bacterium]|nr:tetratricopeptide repeat protein [Bryobacteraceae bacterium]